jgi:hypothetical protein
MIYDMGLYHTEVRREGIPSNSRVAWRGNARPNGETGRLASQSVKDLGK